MDATSSDIQSKVQQISSLYGISTIGITQKLQSLQSVVLGASRSELLEVLLKSDLNPQRAANLYFNQKQSLTQHTHTHSTHNPHSFQSVMPIHPISLISPMIPSLTNISINSPITPSLHSKTPSPTIYKHNTQITQNAFASPNDTILSSNSNTKKVPEITNALNSPSIRHRKRKRSKTNANMSNSDATKPMKRRSARIKRLKKMAQMDSDSDNTFCGDMKAPSNKRRKYDFSEATKMIIEILGECENETLNRYKLLAKLQKRNKGKTWRESFHKNVGEFNTFLKGNKDLMTFTLKLKDGNDSRNFGVRTRKKYVSMLRYRHCLYESDSETDCLCGIIN